MYFPFGKKFLFESLIHEISYLSFSYLSKFVVIFSILFLTSLIHDLKMKIVE